MLVAPVTFLVKDDKEEVDLNSKPFCNTFVIVDKSIRDMGSLLIFKQALKAAIF